MTENHGTGVSSPETLSSVGEFLGPALSCEEERVIRLMYVTDWWALNAETNATRGFYLITGEDVMYESSRTRHVQHGGML